MIIVYQDEVHFQITTTITRQWVIRGSAPIVKSPAGKKSIAYSGFVFPKDGRLVVTNPEWFTAENTIRSLREFLEKIPLKSNQVVHMILDNAPWHRKAIRLIEDQNNPEYADIRAKVVFVRLPPYSPDLNPIEQVWRITRREVTHNRYFKSRDALKEKLDVYFDGLSKPNEKLRKLCLFNYQS